MPGWPAMGPAADPPPGARLALVVATSTYADSGLRRLRAPARDAADLAQVLADPGIGGFTVSTVIDRRAQQIRLAIQDFLDGRGTGDLLLVYLSCHGLVDARRRLYFAAKDTRKDRLEATGVEAAWVLDQLEHCRARRQVLILDTCFSGAFAHGAKGEADLGLDRFLGQGRGRVVLTASAATEYSFEGDPTDAATASGSVFTAALVQGLRTGAADTDRDGYVSVDDAYAYVFDQVQAVGAPQTPQRWLYGAEGQILLARNPAGPVVIPALSPRPTLVSAPPFPSPPSHLARILTGHTMLVFDVAFSPDGRLLATAGQDGTARLWDPATGDCLRTLTGHTNWIKGVAFSTNYVNGVAFSPDGRLLATAGQDGTVRLWDPATGDCLRTLTGHKTDAVYDVAFSPDGRLLATVSSDKTARLWDPATGDCLRTLTGHFRRLSNVAFSPDGRLLATVSDDRTARLWDPATGDCLRTLTGHTGLSGVGVWRSARTGACSPPPARTGQCGCGTRPPATACAPSPATPVGSLMWRSARTGACSPPPAATRRCGCGTRPPATACAPSPATPARSGLWRSARTGACSPPPAATRRCGCGTRPPATACAPSPATPARSGLWRSARTGACWPAAATTRRRGCGTDLSPPNPGSEEERYRIFRHVPKGRPGH